MIVTDPFLLSVTSATMMLLNSISLSSHQAPVRRADTVQSGPPGTHTSLEMGSPKARACGNAPACLGGPAPRVTARRASFIATKARSGMKRFARRASRIACSATDNAD
eukprot:10860097-Heterocapsa_arctica.AAC.1